MISVANSATVGILPTWSSRPAIVPGSIRSNSFTVMVPSIMSPDTTARSIPCSVAHSRTALSQARLLTATGAYAAGTGRCSTKCAWWLVTNTLREPGLKSAASVKQHHLRVPIETQRVSLINVCLHAAGGVQHDQVESAKLLADRADHSLDSAPVSEISAEGCRSPTAIFDLLDDLLSAPGLLPIGDGDAHTLSGQLSSRSAPIPREDPVTSATGPVPLSMTIRAR